jgi:hypothetical protein
MKNRSLGNKVFEVIFAVVKSEAMAVAVFQRIGKSSVLLIHMEGTV